MHQIVRGADALHGADDRFGFKHVAGHDLGAQAHLRAKRFRAAGQASHRQVHRFEPAEKVAADITGRSGQKDTLRGGMSHEEFDATTKQRRRQDAIVCYAAS